MSTWYQRPHSSTYQTHGMSAALLAELTRLAELTKPFHRKLLDEAKAFLASSQNDMAVVWAQVACEQCTEWAITTLLSARDEGPLMSLVIGWQLGRSYDIVASQRVRGLYETLSGDSPTQQPFWKQLAPHHERRNRLVHQGQKCTPEDAAASVAAVDAYIGHVEQVTQLIVPAKDPGAVAQATLGGPALTEAFLLP